MATSDALELGNLSFLFTTVHELIFFRKLAESKLRSGPLDSDLFLLIGLHTELFKGRHPDAQLRRRALKSLTTLHLMVLRFEGRPRGVCTSYIHTDFLGSFDLGLRRASSPQTVSTRELDIGRQWILGVAVDEYRWPRKVFVHNGRVSLIDSSLTPHDPRAPNSTWARTGLSPT